MAIKRERQNIKSQERKFQPQIEATGVCESGGLKLKTLNPAVLY